MEIPKQQILEFVPGGPGNMRRAAAQLPDCVDVERDAGLLAAFDIDIQALLGQFNGSVHQK